MDLFRVTDYVTKRRKIKQKTKVTKTFRVCRHFCLKNRVFQPLHNTVIVLP